MNLFFTKSVSNLDPPTGISNLSLKYQTWNLWRSLTLIFSWGRWISIGKMYLRKKKVDGKNNYQNVYPKSRRNKFTCLQSKENLLPYYNVKKDLNKLTPWEKQMRKIVVSVPIYIVINFLRSDLITCLIVWSTFPDERLYFPFLKTMKHNKRTNFTIL